MHRLPAPYYRTLWIILLLIAFAPGCTLLAGAAQISSGDRDNPLPTSWTGIPAVTPTSQATAAPLPTSTLIPTVTPFTTSGGSSGGVVFQPPQPACVVRADWPVYGVVAGDTLASIARRTGTTADQLARANCLANPNLIAVGQGLRVPWLPAPVPTVPPPPTTRGYVSITPSTLRDGWAVLTPNQQAILQWIDPPPGTQIARAVFYIAPTGTGTYDARVPIGSDNNPWDGITFAWTVPAGGTYGHLWAEGYSAQNLLVSSSALIGVLTDAPPPPPDDAVLGAFYTTVNSVDYADLVKGTAHVPVFWRVDSGSPACLTLVQLIGQNQSASTIIPIGYVHLTGQLDWSPVLVDYGDGKVHLQMRCYHNGTDLQSIQEITVAIVSVPPPTVDCLAPPYPPDGGIVTGGQADVLAQVAVQAYPTPLGLQLGTLQSGQVVSVISGPLCYVNNGQAVRLWEISAPSGSDSDQDALTGWAAEVLTTEDGRTVTALQARSGS